MIHKNYSTVTIATPVEINGTIGIVAVAVRKTGKNRYYTHRILLPNGVEFVFEKSKNAEPTSVGIPATSDRPGPTISSASNVSISQESGDVKSEFSDGGVKWSLREEAPPKKTLTGYKVFVVKDGKLYPPMVANPEGADTPVGVWLNADISGRATLYPDID